MYSPGFQLGKRIVGGAIALICLWLSAGAVLVHTDDLSTLRTFASGGTSALHHAAAPTTVQQCAACEWTQATGSLQTPTLSIVTLPFVRVERTPCVPDSFHLLAFTHTLLRGPPIS